MITQKILLGVNHLTTFYHAKSINKSELSLRLEVCTLTFIILTTVLVYTPTFTNQFQMLWDDWWVVMNDYTEGGWTLKNFSRILTEYYNGQYAPINEIFYLFTYEIFGYDPYYFHSASLVIHLANVVLVYYLCKKVLRFDKKLSRIDQFMVGIFVSLFFSLHPINVEAVAWISASKCILYTFFYLIALLFYMRYLESNSMKNYWIVILFFLLSFGAKEQAVVLPASLVLIDYIYGKNLKRLDVYLNKIPFILLSLLFIVITFYSQKDHGQGVLTNQPSYPWYQNIVFAAYSLIQYSIKCILPINLSYIYPFPNLPHEPLPKFLWIYPILLAAPIRQLSAGKVMPVHLKS